MSVRATRRFWFQIRFRFGTAPPLLVAGITALALGACERPALRSGARIVHGGDPAQGRVLLQVFGCTACHTIPGLRAEAATVAPPLSDWAARRYIAGRLLNTPENLMRWIMEPDSVEPGTAMPDLGVNAAEARDIAAYLFSLGVAGPPTAVDLPRLRGTF